MRRLHHKRNVTVALLLAVALVGWAGWQHEPGGLHRPPGDSAPDEAMMRLLEQHIPFALQARAAPGPHCDVIDLEIVVMLDEQGRELEYRWRVMDGDTVQLECADFYDLYYRCDAPSCYQIRAVWKRETAEKPVAVRRGAVCLE
ncbi:MAG TPA: hypothetical protein PKE26_08690 [Kiritimatiellia bacterium]|nr:hypothetical protein [Kiritimatiellia bacterium]HMO99172.1 hypothetical protein [Kiritimatiellia bacterium]HMP95759.1 hypothetical protein [Kiritimatiellia bacterium]